MHNPARCSATICKLAELKRRLEQEGLGGAFNVVGVAYHPPYDVHRPLRPDDRLDDAFAWKEERTVSNSLTLQYDQVLFILEPTEVTRPLARKRVTVFDYPDGRLAIRYKGLELPYRVFDRQQRIDPAAVVDNTRLGAVLRFIAERQAQVAVTRSNKAPRRRGQGNSLFKVG